MKLSSNDETNPYAPPVDIEPFLPSSQLGELLGEIEVVDLFAKKEPWKLLIFADVLRFEPHDDGSPVDVPRNGLSQKTTVHHSIFMRRSLEIKKTKTRKMQVFQFSAEGFRRLKEWIGLPTPEDLRVALKKRLGYVFPIGLMYLVFSLPRGAGVDAVPLNLLDFGLGASLVAVGVGAKWKPHRRFFLADGCWFLLLAFITTYRFIVAMNGWWLFFAILQLSLFASGVSAYRRFAILRAPVESPSQTTTS